MLGLLSRVSRVSSVSVVSVMSGDPAELGLGRGLCDEMGTRLQFSSSTVEGLAAASDFLSDKSRGCSDCSFTGFERSNGASVVGLSGDGCENPARSRKLSKRPMRANIGLTLAAGNIGLEAVWELVISVGPVGPGSVGSEGSRTNGTLSHIFQTCKNTTFITLHILQVTISIFSGNL